MEKLCKELDDVKAAMEKLTAENRTKTELSESLRKSHNEQLIKIKEAKLEIAKQAHELNAKTEEISVMKQMFEDAKSTLQEKELNLRQLRSAHDKMRADYGEKLQALEGKNGELISALDEANTRIQKQDQKIHDFKEEIERMKSLLSVSQKKASEAEQKAQALKDMRQRDDLLMNLEEENVKIKDQLKWKKEQFKHLQEAHEKVQDQFRVSKKEWEHEKSTLVDEIYSLQTRLDSQIRISESLQNKLQMCNQALAHEESRRKLLEVQMSESKACYENVFAECQEAKSKIEILSVKRDDEIAALRNSLGTKETLLKEAEYRREYLEQENQELRISLREFQEAQIKNSGSVSSLTKLRNKLRSLEQVHKDCSQKLNARETEWSSQMENMIGDLNNCKSELDSKDREIQELQIELENCYSSIMQLKLQNEEINVMLTVYQSGLTDAHSNFSKPELEMELHIKEAEEKIALLTEQLDKKNNAMVKAHAEIEQERGIAASLMGKIELLDPLEQKYMLTLNELENCKEMLEESYVQQLRLKEQALQMENALKEDLRKISDAFDEVSSELAERIQEESEIEFELDRWKSTVEHLQRCLAENQEFRREMEGSLLAQVETEQTLKQEKDHLQHLVEEKDKRADDLQQVIVSLKQEHVRSEAELTTSARMASQNEFEQEKENLLHIVDEKEKNINNLVKKIDWMEQEFMRRELDAMRRELEAAIIVQIETEKSMEQEKERLLQVLEKKDHIIEHLQLQAIEHNLDMKRKQAHIETFHEACETVLTAQVLAELETQLKNTIIMELEEEIISLQQKLESQEKSISCSKYQVEQVEVALEAKQLEMETFMVQLGNKLRISESYVEKLESENRYLIQDLTKLSTEKGDLLCVVEEFSEQLNGFSNKDRELMNILGRMVENLEAEDELLMMGIKGCFENYDSSSRENEPFSFSTKHTEAISDRRSPLIERNN